MVTRKLRSTRPGDGTGRKAAWVELAEVGQAPAPCRVSMASAAVKTVAQAVRHRAAGEWEAGAGDQGLVRLGLVQTRWVVGAKARELVGRLLAFDWAGVV